jgi:hypothetical protein
MLRHNRSMLLAMTVLFASFMVGGAIQAQAHDGDRNQNGYWDRNGNYHHYGYYHHHRGYWNQNNSGVRFWINVS